MHDDGGGWEGGGGEVNFMDCLEPRTIEVKDARLVRFGMALTPDESVKLRERKVWVKGWKEKRRQRLLIRRANES